MARQIITGDTIHQTLAENQTELRVDPDAIITDAARELAESRGVRLVRADVGSPSPAPSAPVESVVRAAVVKALGGSAPPDLDAVIARVMRG